MAGDLREVLVAGEEREPVVDGDGGDHCIGGRHGYPPFSQVTMEGGREQVDLPVSLQEREEEKTLPGELEALPFPDPLEDLLKDNTADGYPVPATDQLFQTAVLLA